MPHLECAAVTVRERAILISIRLCLSSLSTHKSLLQSEINSYWSALISQVRHEANAATGTSHRSKRRKHHFVCEIPTLHAAPAPLTLTRRNDGVWSSKATVSRSTHMHMHACARTHTHTLHILILMYSNYNLWFYIKNNTDYCCDKDTIPTFGVNRWKISSVFSLLGTTKTNTSSTVNNAQVVLSWEVVQTPVDSYCRIVLAGCSLSRWIVLYRQLFFQSFCPLHLYQWGEAK